MRDFLNNLNGILDRVSRGFRVNVLGYMNGWIGNWKSITGAFGIERENENGRKVIDFCMDRVIISLITRVLLISKQELV